MTLTNGSAYIRYEITDVYDGGDCSLSVTAEASFLRVVLPTVSSLGVFRRLYERLSDCNERLSGSVEIDSFSYERDISLTVSYIGSGHVSVTADMRSNADFGNRCSLAFQTDQTFVTRFLHEIKAECNL